MSSTSTPTGTTAQSAVRYERDEDGIVTLTMDDPTASANTMNDLYVDSRAAAVDRLHDEVDDVTGVVVTSAKKTFFAGGNLTLLSQATPADAPRIFETCERIKAGLRRLETYPRPVVAAVNGAALGGGLEIALAASAYSRSTAAAMDSTYRSFMVLALAVGSSSVSVTMPSESRS